MTDIYYKSKSVEILSTSARVSDKRIYLRNYLLDKEIVKMELVEYSNLFSYHYYYDDFKTEQTLIDYIFDSLIVFYSYELNTIRLFFKNEQDHTLFKLKYGL